MNFTQHRVVTPDWLLSDGNTQHEGSGITPNVWVPRGMKAASTFTLPDGRIFTVVRKRTDITSESIIGKAGVKAVMDTSLGSGQQMSWIHSSSWGNTGKSPAANGYPIQDLTESEVRAIARSIPPGWAEANELYEGNPWGTSDHNLQQFHWWYDERRIIYQ